VDDRSRDRTRPGGPVETVRALPARRRAGIHRRAAGTESFRTKAVGVGLRSAGDSIAADEIEAALRTPRPLVVSGERELQTRDLPKRVLYLLLADTLTPDQPYELSLAGVTNINGVPGGGGTAEVLREASEPNE